MAKTSIDTATNHATPSWRSNSPASAQRCMLAMRPKVSYTETERQRCPLSSCRSSVGDALPSNETLWSLTSLFLGDDVMAPTADRRRRPSSDEEAGPASIAAAPRAGCTPTTPPPPPSFDEAPYKLATTYYNCCYCSELSRGWADPWVGLGWVH